MQINGEWSLCDDGAVRPVVYGEMRTGNGLWIPVEFLMDTGADRTVLSASTFVALQLQPLTVTEHLGGLGGVATAVIVETQMRFVHEAAGTVTFRGQYAAVTERDVLDMSVLGRDITNVFAVIVDHPGHVVCLLGQQHQYTIVQR